MPIFDVNPASMKRSIFKALAFSFVFFLAFSSCELLDCATCELVTLTNGVETARGPGVLYCGEELQEKESYSQTLGYTYTYYDCN
jgi:hypothetical protein